MKFSSRKLLWATWTTANDGSIETTSINISGGVGLVTVPGLSPYAPQILNYAEAPPIAFMPTTYWSQLGPDANVTSGDPSIPGTVGGGLGYNGTTNTMQQWD